MDRADKIVLWGCAAALLALCLIELFSNVKGVCS